MAKPELGGQIPFFFESFLSKPASALPKGAQWVLTFDGVFNESPSGANSNNNSSEDQILPVRAIKYGIKYEPQTWAIDDAIAATLTTDYQNKKGCLFVQAVQIPGESNQVNPEGFQQSGYIRSVTGNGRDAFANLQISFLETNVSFVDNVIRPWVIATAHLGMIARENEKNYRCNLSVYKLGVITPLDTPHITQKYTFFGACPIDVTGEEYNYTQTTSPVNRNASFTYHYYTIESSTGNSSLTRNNESIPMSFSTSTYRSNAVVPTDQLLNQLV